MGSQILDHAIKHLFKNNILRDRDDESFDAAYAILCRAWVALVAEERTGESFWGLPTMTVRTEAARRAT